MRRSIGALWAACGAAGAALVALFQLWTPPGEAERSLCFFRHFLGIPCPGCGMTRALAALARGDVATSFALHPLAPLFAAEALLAWIVWGLVLARRWPLPSARRLDTLLAVHAALLLALWTGRLATGSLGW